MAIENVELMHECSPKHFYKGTVRLQDKETEKEVKQKRVKMEISKVLIKEKKSQRPNYSSGLPSSRDHYSPKPSMNYLANLTYIQICLGAIYIKYN